MRYVHIPAGGLNVTRLSEAEVKEAAKLLGYDLVPRDRVEHLYLMQPVDAMHLEYAKFEIPQYLRNRAGSEFSYRIAPKLTLVERKMPQTFWPPQVEFITSARVICDTEEEIKAWLGAEPRRPRTASPQAEGPTVGKDVQEEKP